MIPISQHPQVSKQLANNFYQENIVRKGVRQMFYFYRYSKRSKALYSYNSRVHHLIEYQWMSLNPVTYINLLNVGLFDIFYFWIPAWEALVQVQDLSIYPCNIHVTSLNVYRNEQT